MAEQELTKAQRLAEEVLRLSRNTLLVYLRFLDMALSRLELKPCDRSTLLTDGQYLLYHAPHVLKSFQYQKEIPVRDYLHVVMHCVYRHMFTDPSVDRPLWDLACDIAVEAVISELGLKAAEASRQRTQEAELQKLREECPLLTAERLYAHFKSAASDPTEAAKLRALFYADNHEIWYMTDEEKRAAFGIGDPSGGDGDGEGDGDEDGNRKKNGRPNGRSLVMMTEGELSEQWKQIAERMQVDIETFGKQRGDQAGALMQNLKEVNREKYDYTAFLKKFAVMGETMKINDDEFDYIFYTYGLQLYDKMPLVEPLEYKDVKRIKEFVIAIDTSGSVQGELVQAFVQKTYNILKSTESFFSKINLHIIQCDTKIHEHIKITTQEEFDEYLKGMTLKGFGGTDFRPVFASVDDLIRQKEFVNLKGLIYFTDGCGVYPERKPAYDTAFVFVEDGCNDYHVPPWAIKLVLRKEEL